MPLQDEISATIKPGQDLYRSVNDKWLTASEIPANKSRIGVLTSLSDENVERLRTLFERSPAKSEPVNIRRAKSLYASAMDEATIEQTGIKPLQTPFDEINRIETHESLFTFLANWHGRGFGLVWHIGLDVDDKDSARYVMRISQSGLGLPDRDYYFNQGQRFEDARQAYRTYLQGLFELLGHDNARTYAKKVYALEEKLAAASNTATENRDTQAKYNPYQVQALSQTFPHIDWKRYLKQLGLSDVETLLVSQPTFIKAALELLYSQPIEAWRWYILSHCVAPLMTSLPQVYDQLSFDFYGRALSGATEQEPRYRRSINRCMSILPEPTGQLFVEAHFDEAAKESIYDLVDHIKLALRGRIQKLDWMSGATKQRALEKLDTFLPLLGYPDTWRDYTNLQLDHSYVENILALHAFDWQYDVARLNQPVDRKEWLMSPAMVNAYYWSSTNGITFPAGILQPPLFDAAGDFAANYGGIGMVIGHEITHGFDDQGSQFDEKGNMRPWWTTKDRKAFETKSKLLEEQYSSYEIDGHPVNGALTLGENIADLGGLLIAYDALQAKLKESGETEAIDGFTPEQRFFLSFARIWRERRRPELTLRHLVTDPHAPAMLRVNGVVANVDAYYDAFPVAQDSPWHKMPDARVRIW